MEFQMRTRELALSTTTTRIPSVQMSLGSLNVDALVPPALAEKLA
jgi:hypothetical protein